MCLLLQCIACNADDIFYNIENGPLENRFFKICMKLELNHNESKVAAGLKMQTSADLRFLCRRPI